MKQKQHVEKTPLTPFWEKWDGRVVEIQPAFHALDLRLSRSEL